MPIQKNTIACSWPDIQFSPHYSDRIVRGISAIYRYITWDDNSSVVKLLKIKHRKQVTSHQTEGARIGGEDEDGREEKKLLEMTPKRVLLPHWPW